MQAGRWCVAMAWLMAGCVDAFYPDCDGKFEALTVTADTSGPAPVFSWDLDADAAVVKVEDPEEAGEGNYLWSLQCGGDQQTLEGTLEHEACIPGPLTYGVQPTSEFLDPSSEGAKELTSGETYTVFVLAYLEGESKDCGDAHGGEVAFVAP